MDHIKHNNDTVVLGEENRRFAMRADCRMCGCLKTGSGSRSSIIAVAADNIRFFPRGEYVYKLLLAGTASEKCQYHMIGNISLTADGCAEGSFSINPEDLDGSGIRLTDFNAAVIAAASTVNQKEPLHTVLRGSLEPLRRQLSPATAPAVSPAGMYSHGSGRDSSSFPKDDGVLEKCRIIVEESSPFPEVIPFDRDIAGASWKKITVPALFPLASPGSTDPVTEYGHFLFGCCSSHYLVGVPGRFLPDEQPDAGKTGFIYWQPIAGMPEESRDATIPLEERRKDIYGYWLAAISRSTGHIEEMSLIEN